MKTLLMSSLNPFWHVYTPAKDYTFSMPSPQGSVLVHCAVSNPSKHDSHIYRLKLHYFISFPNYCLFHHRFLSLCLCLVSTLLFSNLSMFPIGRCVLTEIKASSSRLVSGKDKGVFWGLVIQSMCFWFPCCPLAKSINRGYCVWDSSRK